jgi:hypothetical protein
MTPNRFAGGSLLYRTRNVSSASLSDKITIAIPPRSENLIHKSGKRLHNPTWLPQFGEMRIMNATTVTMTKALAIGLVLAASFLVARLSHAQEAGSGDAELRAIIDKAIKAHGGAEKLSQFKVVTAKGAGKHKVENVHFWDAVRTVKYEAPDKIRLDYEVMNPINNTTFAFTRVVNGKKGWQGTAARTRDLSEADVTHICEEFYAHWLASAVPLQDKGFTFSPYGNFQVDGKDAVGVGVAFTGRPTVNLCFDKKSGLVVKSERRTKDPRTQEEYNAESIYRDHKEFQGVMWATGRLDRRDNIDLEEKSGLFELSDFRASDKLEEASLAKP